MKEVTEPKHEATMGPERRRRKLADCVKKVRKAKSRETIELSVIAARKFDSRRPFLLNHSFASRANSSTTPTFSTQSAQSGRARVCKSANPRTQLI